MHGAAPVYPQQPSPAQQPSPTQPPAYGAPAPQQGHYPPVYAQGAPAVPMSVQGVHMAPTTTYTPPSLSSPEHRTPGHRTKSFLAELFRAGMKGAFVQGGHFFDQVPILDDPQEKKR